MTTTAVSISLTEAEVIAASDVVCREIACLKRVLKEVSGLKSEPDIDNELKLD